MTNPPTDRRRIRISVEIYNHDPGDEYEELPDGWDEWNDEKQDAHLVEIAKLYLFEVAGSGASVVNAPDSEQP